MAEREVIILNEPALELQAAQSGDTYKLPRATKVDSQLANTVAILTLANSAGSVGFFRVDATPEGAVTAGIGSVATDAVNGKIYKKETGAGNTGWIEIGAGGGGGNSKTEVRVVQYHWSLPSYTQAGAGVGATLTADAVGILTIDGVDTVLNDLILIAGASTGGTADSGLYKVTTEGTAGVAFVLTRDVDADEAAEYSAGHTVYVEEGDVHTGSTWVYEGDETLTVDTTTIQYRQQLGGDIVGVAGELFTKFGLGAGASVNRGMQGNLAIGAYALSQNVPATDNSMIGFKAGYNVNGGGYNTALGSLAIGSGACTSASGYNIAIGYKAGYVLGAAIKTTLIGAEAGMVMTTADGNFGGGYRAMYSVTTGNNNAAVGREVMNSAAANATGNVCIGYQAGYQCNGYNVMLGYQAGYSETGSDKLYIDNSNDTTPLIYGDFSTDNISFNLGADFGGGQGVIGIKNAVTVPTTNPTAAGLLYVEGGALKYRGSSGTITVLGVA